MSNDWFTDEQLVAMRDRPEACARKIAGCEPTAGQVELVRALGRLADQPEGTRLAIETAGGATGTVRMVRP